MRLPLSTFGGIDLTDIRRVRLVFDRTPSGAINVADATLRLRAERDKNADGRVYLILARAIDSAGAGGKACCTVTVPNGNKPEDATAVS